MKRLSLISSLFFLTSCLVAQEVDHVWLYNVRHYIAKNYMFQNIKELESKVSIFNSETADNPFTLVRAVYPNFLKDFQQNELLQRFKAALHSEDYQESGAARQMLMTIQSEVCHRLEWFERRYQSLNKRSKAYLEKVGFSAGAAIFLEVAGVSCNKIGIVLSGAGLGLVSAAVYCGALLSMAEKPLLYCVCAQELEKINTYLDEVANVQGSDLKVT